LDYANNGSNIAKPINVTLLHVICVRDGSLFMRRAPEICAVMFKVTIVFPPLAPQEIPRWLTFTPFTLSAPVN
jgi:hypothetical protein